MSRALISVMQSTLSYKSLCYFSGFIEGDKCSVPWISSYICGTAGIRPIHVSAVLFVCFAAVYQGSPGTRSHPCDRGAGGVVPIADRAWFSAQWGSAVRGTVRPSPSTSHRRHTHSSLLPATCRLALWGLSLWFLPVHNERTGQTHCDQGWVSLGFYSDWY